MARKTVLFVDPNASPVPRVRHSLDNLVPRDTQQGYVYNSDSIEIPLIDDRGGCGRLFLVGSGQPQFVQNAQQPQTSSYWGTSYVYGKYYYPEYRILGANTPDEYYYHSATFSLKSYENDKLYPSSVASATTYPSLEAAVAAIRQFFADGAPGLQLEHPYETKRRQDEARSSVQLSYIKGMLGQLTDEDLVLLSEKALSTITARAEAIRKAAARAEAKRLKNMEKAAILAAKEAAKAAKIEAKRLKDEAAAQKAAAKADAKRLKDEAAARKAAKALNAAPAVTASSPS